MSEETDAGVIVVSEETGIISFMTEGKAIQDIDEEKLKELLFEKEEAQKAGSKKKRSVESRSADRMNREAGGEKQKRPV